MAVHKTKTGYQVQWYDADGRFRKRTFRGVTRDQAAKIERDLLARRDRGEPEIDRRLAPTFRAFATTWLDEHSTGWKPSTREQYAHAIDRWLAPAFGEVRVCDLAEPRVRRLFAELQERGLSPKRINFVVLVFRMIVKVAVRRRLLRDNPCEGIRSLREPRTDVDPFSPEDVTAFLAACPAYWRPYFTVAFWTGARPGELAALKWGNVDLGRGSFCIRAGRSRGVEGSPKTESSNRYAAAGGGRLAGAAGAAGDGAARGRAGGSRGRTRLRLHDAERTVRRSERAATARLGPHHSPREAPAADDVPDPSQLRVERPGSGRAAVVGGRDARAHDARNALQRLRAVHPEPHAARRQRVARAHGHDAARGTVNEPEKAGAYSRFTPVAGPGRAETVRTRALTQDAMRKAGLLS